MDQVRRRNSILKTETGDATPTKTMTKNKRISFSGKNSVKEFIEGNDKNTIWGTSYEKEMEAMQKQGDSMVPSQIDLSTYDSTALSNIVSNKENLPDSKPIRMSCALLDGENSSCSITPNMNVTALNMLPGDSLGSETVVGQIFQMQAYEAGRISQPPVTNVASTTNLNHTAMELSMIWQDIISQTKEAGGMNKTSSRMGNTIQIIPDPEATSRAPLANRQTIYYNGQASGDMEIDKTARVSTAASQRTIYYQTANDGMDESDLKGPTKAHQRSVYYSDEGNMEQSIVAQKNRQTIHFNDENGRLDESSARQQDRFDPQKNLHQTIHFQSEGSAMEESALDVTKYTATRGRDSYFPGGTINESEKENQVIKRQTIHYPADGGVMDESVRDEQEIYGNAQPAAMEQSIVVDQRQMITRKPRDSCFIVPESKESLKEPRPAAAKIRQTIHYQAQDGDMDETQHHGQGYGNNPSENGKKTSRQTIVFKGEHAGMDESTQKWPIVDEVEPEHQKFIEQKTFPKSSRQSIHYNGNEGAMDESSVLNPNGMQLKKNPRQSIHFNEMNGGMEESMQMYAPTVQHNQTRPMEEVRQMKTTRQTICFKPDEGNMEESIQCKRDQTKLLNNPRQTIHFRPEEAAMDESGYQTVVPPTNPNRQTLHFNATQGAMEESRTVSPNPQATVYYTDQDQMEVDENTPQKINAKRETVYYQANDGNMDESQFAGHQFIPKPVPPVENVPRKVNPKARQTVYYQDENGGLDETQIGKEEEKYSEVVHKKSRQTIYDDTGMDVSLTNYGQDMTIQPPVSAAPQRSMRNTRHTVYYQDAGLDVSCAPANQEQRQVNAVTEHSAGPPSRRGTIYYDQTGMEESIMVAPREHSVIHAVPVLIAPVPKGRQTIHYNNPDEAGLDETTIVTDMEKPIGPLQRSIMMQSMSKSVLGIQSPLERSLLMQQSQIKENQRSFRQPVLQGHQTIYHDDNAMEESIQVQRQRPDKSAYQANVTVAEKPSRGTIYTAATMEESIRAPNIRRETYTVPVNETLKPEMFAASSTMKNGTVFEIDSMVSDLNNVHDSMELMDSFGNACPVGASKFANQLSYRSSKSPDLVNETVNDLNLNFNVTGQIILPKDKVASEQSTKNASSKIPVRTPSKKKSMGKYDVSVVDVARDASVIVPRSRFHEDEMVREHTFADPIKPDLRMSIPVFSVNNNEDLSMDYQQAMKGDVTVEMAADETTKEKVELKANRARIERLVDVEKFKGMDFNAGVPLIKELIFKVHKVCNTILIEQSMYIPNLGSEISMKQKIFDQAKEEIEQRIRELKDESDLGCFPLCLPMEDMIKNLVESEHKSWRYQDLYYHMGFLKFRHRLVKTFQVVIKFSVDDEEFSREHYLSFERFRIIEDDLKSWSALDQKMHKELMRSIPMGLVTLYGTSIDLGRFLSDVDKICRRIFKDFAC